MNIHAIQFAPAWENKASSFERIHQLLQATPPPPGSLIVLPEMFATGFSYQLNVTLEEPGGQTENFMRELAAHWQCAVLGGLITTGPDGMGLNQALVISPDGIELLRYTKIHPFSFGEEGAVHAPGAQTGVFTWGGVQITPLICYDLRFPELARSALSQGAELYIYIAAWPARRIQHWQSLLQARAIANQAYVLGVNRCGQEPEVSYCGRSLIVDPQGVILADASDAEKVLSISIDLQNLRHWRQEFPAVRDYLKDA